MDFDKIAQARRGGGFAVIGSRVSWLLERTTLAALPYAGRLFVSAGRGAVGYCGHLLKVHGVAALPNPDASFLERADVVVLCEDCELNFEAKPGAPVLRCEVDKRGDIVYNWQSERIDEIVEGFQIDPGEHGQAAGGIEAPENGAGARGGRADQRGSFLRRFIRKQRV
ncbi:hypothetical protein FACS1894217_14520 [Clostridia bacterium]|nr:hypothetical protein FACS1894217_14520 [Clostridia bacterium]